MSKIFLIIIIMFNGETIQIKEFPGPANTTMANCQQVADAYNTLQVPKGYEIRATCEDRGLQI